MSFSAGDVEMQPHRPEASNINVDPPTQPEPSASRAASKKPSLPELGHGPKMCLGGCCGLFLFVGCLLTLIMVPLSFSYIDRNHYGFKKDTIRNKVDVAEVYTNGRYFWGLGKGAVSFPSSFHFEHFTGSTALSTFDSTGLEIKLDVSFQWRITRDSIPGLYNDFGPPFPSQVPLRAIKVLKNSAKSYDLDSYVKRRAEVAASFARDLSRNLTADLGIDMPEANFQLRRIELPPAIQQKFLNTAVLIQSDLETQFDLVALQERKTTELQVQEIAANTTIVQQQSIAEVAKLITLAQATADRLLEEANGFGINSAVEALGLTDSKDIQKFHELEAILKNPSTQFIVGLSGSNVLVNSQTPP